jgi:uncharacterized protein (DUF305 family)
VVTAVLVGVAAFSLGRISAPENPRPSNTSAEAGFARDMQVHHDQGVELANIVRDLTTDEPVRLLALDIAAVQGQQSGQLYGWLTEWGLPQAAREPSMTWMSRPGRSVDGHTHAAAHSPGAPMPGLATAEQIAELNAASGIEAERIFLTLMIAHHQGAVDMAEAALDRAANTSVLAFATAVVRSQAAEIDLMTRMLADRTP